MIISRKWYLTGALAAVVGFSGAVSAQTAEEPAPAETPAAGPAAEAAPATEAVPATPASYAGAEGTKVEIVVEKAILALNEGNPQEALTLADEALKVKPGNPDLLRIKGVALNALNRPEEAQSTLLQVTKEDPGYKAHYTPLGTAYVKQEKYDLAEPAFKKGADADPADGAARYGLGLCALHKGDLKGAAGWFEQSAALGTNRSASEFFRARALYDAGEQDQAKDGFQALVARDPDSPHGREAKNYLAKLGVGEADMGKTKEKGPFNLVPSVALGATVDSNTGLTPDGEILPVFLKKKADSRVDLDLGLDATFKANEQFTLGLGLGDFESAYLNNTDYNQGGTTAYLSGLFETGAKKEEIGVSLNYDYAWVRIGRYSKIKTALADTNGDGVIGDPGDDPTPQKWGIRYGTFNHAHTLNLQVYKRADALTFFAKAYLGWDLYPNKNFAPGLNNNNRDSRNNGLSVGGNWAIETVAAGTDIGWINRNARGSEYSYTGFRWNTNAQWLPVKTVAVRNTTMLDYKIYGTSTGANCGLVGGVPGSDPCIVLGSPVDSERREWTFNWSPEIAYKVTKITEVYLNYSIELRNASLAAFEYERQTVGMGVRATWE